MVAKEYENDMKEILAHRFDLGADLWTTGDRRLIKGSPFSTLESAGYLLELGMECDNAIIKECAALIFDTWQDDGRFRLVPKGTIYPCQTIHATSLLCRMGYLDDSRIQKTLEHLLASQEDDGGWRCRKFSYGHGEETEASNPFPTLVALDAFRYSKYLNSDPALDRAVEFLLDHWSTRLPLGPCHYGIGSLFMQVEYPFRNYNLFIYVYVLSFYNAARKDPRFQEALAVLESKLDDGQVVVERVVPKLAKLSFCQKGQPSKLATIRYQEIIKNLQQ